MKPAYIQLEDNIHIRLDFFRINTISIVKKADGVTLSSDEIIATFPPLKSDILSKDGRGLLKDAIAELFAGIISTEKIEEALVAMEDKMAEIAKKKLAILELIERGKDKIRLVSGAPRLHKTTLAFKMAVMCKTNIIIYVARTIKTCQQTIETVKNYLPILKDTPITPIIGNINSCKKAKDIFNNGGGYIAASMHCMKIPIEN